MRTIVTRRLRFQEHRSNGWFDAFYVDPLLAAFIGSIHRRSHYSRSIQNFRSLL